MNKQYVLYIIMITIHVISCDKILDTREKPNAIERAKNYYIQLVDESDYMLKLTGNSGVASAEVLLKSLMLGIEYHVTSDTNGIIEMKDIISDEYLITAVRKFTPDEMVIISGIPTANLQLKNITTGRIILRADIDTTVVVPMLLVACGPQLVISEIYACGPPGAGLYYHDKYVELYNQADSIIYLDGLIIAEGGRYIIGDPDFVYSKNVWIFPGTGKDYALNPGEFAVCAEDAIDHRINAPFSVDLSQVKFEFYKEESPDIDNPAIPNMIRILQEYGYDWLIGGEKDGIVLAKAEPDSLQFENEHLLIPTENIIDGVDYLDDPTRLGDKKLHESIDAGSTGGIEFYTGKSMERRVLLRDDIIILKDDNNSSIDFLILDAPTPEYHHEL